jgi:hypothetical protein
MAASSLGTLVSQLSSGPKTTAEKDRFRVSADEVSGDNNSLAPASWCATRGRLHKIGKNRFGAIRTQERDFAGRIDENTHDEPP